MVYLLVKVKYNAQLLRNIDAVFLCQKVPKLSFGEPRGLFIGIVAQIFHEMFTALEQLILNHFSLPGDIFHLLGYELFFLLFILISLMSCWA